MMSSTVSGNLQLSEQELQVVFDLARAQSAKSAGAANPNALYTTMLSQYDRFGVNTMLPNHEVVGYTFITRPKLNLSTPSLRMDRILSLLDTGNPVSLPFAIRCYLDTFYSGSQGPASQLALQCPFYNPESPFIIPLTNNLVSLSGWPDPVVETETTEGGFFSEDMTIAKGSDRLNRTYDLTLTFRDIQGGFILALLYMWIRYIELVVRGDTVAYADDINNRRVNYTCSIYRFIMDPSRQFITKWSKATGCFPKSIPVGNVFNFGDGEKFITSSAQYSVNFVANKVEIFDPIIFRDFNTISKRFSPTISGFPGNNAVSVDSTTFTNNNNTPFQPLTSAENNFVGLPYVDLLDGYNRLLWIAKSSDQIGNPYTSDLEAIRTLLKTTTSQSNQVSTPSTTFA